MMRDFGYRLLLFLFFFFVFHLTFASPLLLTSRQIIKHKCLVDQRSALVKLQHDLFDNYSSSKVELWDLKTDCCSWEGVTCDAIGHVIGLDLSDRMLSGSYNSIFYLHHLQQLNLAGNDFGSIPIPSAFGKLGNLTHLNLSNSDFSDQIPLEISRLTKLQSLDLSNNGLELQNPNLKTFVQNLTSLTELYLDYVDLSTQGTNWCEVLSHSLPNLKALSLVSCGLSGPICSSISKLHFLSELHLNLNSWSSLPPNFLANSSRLESLGLSYCELQGSFPQHVFLLPKLRSIDISYNSLLSGQLPEFPLNNAMQYLDIGNTNFNGKLPESISNLKFLAVLNLLSCNFCGLIPSSIANLTNIVHLNFGGNSFNGSIPPFHGDVVPYLDYLDLSRNQLKGVIDSTLFTLPSLKILDLSKNQLFGDLNQFKNTSSSLLTSLNLYKNNLEGAIPRSIFQLASLTNLLLNVNKFIEIEEFSNASSSLLQEVRLEGNDLQGPIPMSIFQLPSLVALTLGGNKFSGTMKLDMLQNLTNLTEVDLSDIRMSVDYNNRSHTFLQQLQDVTLSSCNLTRFPEFLKTMNRLEVLILSNNQLHGYIPCWIFKSTLWRLDLSYNEFEFPKQPVQGMPIFNNDSSFFCSNSRVEYLFLSSNKFKGRIPNWIWNENLFHVNLSHNNIDSFDQFSSNVSVTSLENLDLHANQLQGSLPKVFCNASSMVLLDASYNKLSGPIPNCLGNIETLSYLDLQQNNFQGELPDFVRASKLRSIKVNGNKLEGMLPMSNNCTKLEVLDIGDNLIHDTFPFWLKKLPALEVLILRGNRFHGHIEHLGVFPMLHILDLSYNEFDGELSKDFLQSLAPMCMNGNDSDTSEAKYVGDKNVRYYKESVTIMMKGLEMKLERILTILVSLDLSNNKFHGEIPQEIGNLKSLIVLNLSGNNFIGHIPSSLGDLTKLESLDLSRNQLSGKIPQQLTSLTFLSAINLSYNQLVGSIPQGNQFSTFTNASFEGNSGLCDPPLTRKCNETDDDSKPPPVKDEDSSNGSIIDWKFLLMGYGCGLVIGFSIGYTVMAEMGHKWFTILNKRSKKRKNEEEAEVDNS